jgi:aminoglycoside N3'-acetyltransferase
VWRSDYATDRPKNNLRRLVNFCGFQVTPAYRQLRELLRDAHRLRHHAGGRPIRWERGSVSAVSFVRAIAEHGIETGDTVMLHASWRRLSRIVYDQPATFVSALREHLGPHGTLCVPAYPAWGQATMDAQVFNVRTTPSAAGLLSELVRRDAKALRSLQGRSMAAIGRNAAHLTSDHHNSPYASGELSPHYRLSACRGKVMCLGVGATTNTMFHCAEDVLRERFPVRVYSAEPVIWRVVDYTGRVRDVPLFVRHPKWDAVCDSSRLLKYLDASTLWSGRAYGLQCFFFDAERFLAKLLALAAERIHMYGFGFPAAPR